MTDARDLLAEIDATLKLGRERHLDFREQAFNLLVRLRPLVEREGRLREAAEPALEVGYEAARMWAEERQTKHDDFADVWAKLDALRDALDAP